MTTSLDLAITAIRSGRQEEGRQLLNLLIQKNPNNEMAWLWMSSVVDNDEQRARCLYHVLAIDPGNVVARQGLKVLGIVVSDSRPVKVPRDSQPIKIPKPTDAERRPFRLDPQAIADELPFTPVKAPFTSSGQPDSRPPQSSQATPAPQAGSQTGPRQTSSEPVWVKRAKDAPQKAPPPKRQTGPLSRPSEPVSMTPVNTNPTRRPRLQAEPPNEPQRRPSEPVKIKITPRIAPRHQPQRVSSNPAGPAEPKSPPTLQSEAGQPQNQPQNPSQPHPTAVPDQGETQKLQNSPEPSRAQPAPNPTGGGPQAQPNGASPPAQSQPMPSFGPRSTPRQPRPLINGSEAQQGAPQTPLADTGPLGHAPPANQPSTQETRPTQPMPHTNPTMGMPVYPGNDGRPSFGPPAFQANMIPGMPMQQPPPHYYSQAMAAMQPQPLMGMPMNGQPPPAPQPVPLMHSNPTMGMPAPAYLQFQQQPPQNPALHSNLTMAMPTNQPPPVDYRTSRAAPGANRSPKQAEEKEEGVNILAVIIFGSLSVTALGGLGMLILLMATAN